jgi:hypothetical protein
MLPHQAINFMMVLRKARLTIERMADLAAEIGYEALELAESEHWLAIKAGQMIKEERSLRWV